MHSRVDWGSSTLLMCCLYSRASPSRASLRILNFLSRVLSLTKLSSSSVMAVKSFFAALMMAITTSYLTVSSGSCCRCRRDSVMSSRNLGWFSKKCIEYCTQRMRTCTLMSLNRPRKQFQSRGFWAARSEFLSENMRARSFVTLSRSFSSLHLSLNSSCGSTAVSMLGQRMFSS
uniref:Uncharacterized protein n=1 Tax=Ixodes ricinus TaxID=34613 RepID=A0A6B0UZD6_IXORI